MKKIVVLIFKIFDLYEFKLFIKRRQSINFIKIRNIKFFYKDYLVKK